MVLWEILVFYPVAHWVWGGGFLSQMPVLDFAGGIVIHTTAGSSSLVIAYFLGKRKNFSKYGGEFPPSDMTFAAIGASLLYAGWYGFNGGSAFGAGVLSTIAIMNTTFAAASSLLTWATLSYISHRKNRFHSFDKWRNCWIGRNHSRIRIHSRMERNDDWNNNWNCVLVCNQII